MIEIVRERRIEAPAEELWRLVDDVARLPEWFTFAERAELLEGAGVGRRQAPPRPLGEEALGGRPGRRRA